MPGLIRNPTPAQIAAIRNDPNTQWYPGATNVNRRNQPVDKKGNVVSPAGFHPFSGLTDAIGSVVDFLKWIAWLFHPANILRAVEFIVGILMMAWGLKMMTQPRHGQPRHVLRDVIGATFIGRKLRQREGRRMGTREGQRESARMAARREQTREERSASAHERERITINARQAARRQREGQQRSRRARS